MASSNPPPMTPQEIQTHSSFMRQALAMAQKSLDGNETPVGCVFVYDGQVIGRGGNETNRSWNGTRHAEFIGINAILTALNPKGQLQFRPEILRRCVLYVTVEPCIMCASLLRQFGIKKVFYGASNDKFGGVGGVLSVHEGNGAPSAPISHTEEEGGIGGDRTEWDYAVSGGWLREDAIVLLRRFYVQSNERAPREKTEGKGKKERVLRLDVEPLPSPPALGGGREERGGG